MTDNGGKPITRGTKPRIDLKERIQEISPGRGGTPGIVTTFDRHARGDGKTLRYDPEIKGNQRIIGFTGEDGTGRVPVASLDSDFTLAVDPKTGKPVKGAKPKYSEQEFNYPGAGRNRAAQKVLQVTSVVATVAGAVTANPALAAASSTRRSAAKARVGRCSDSRLRPCRRATC